MLKRDIDTGMGIIPDDHEPSRVPRRRANVISLVLVGGGVALFIVLVRDLGVAAVLNNVSLVGFGIVPIVLQEILAFGANTVGWRAAFPPPRPHVPFPTLLIARIAGDAINYLTPTASVGGEFIRSRMLQGYAPTPTVVASLAMARVTQSVGLFAFLVLGVVLVVDGALLPASWRWALYGGLAIFGAFLILLVVGQRRGLFTAVAASIERRGNAAAYSRLRALVERVDREMIRTHAERGPQLLLSATAFGLGFALGAVESYLILWFLGLPATVERALAIEVLGVALNNILFFVPLRAGVQEAGKVLIFTMFGFDPSQGLAAGILYRVRELTWAGIGLLLSWRAAMASSR